MKKKSVIMLLSTLIIGIIIGAAAMNFISHRKFKSFSETPTKENISKKIVRMVDPDEAQLKQIQPVIDKYSEKAYILSKENMGKMFNSFDSLYIELKPFLNDKQKQNFEKKINHIKTELGK
jgi:amino acid permease